MSIKNKGFVLLETIIVMSVLLIGMILLYSNYNRIFMNSGKISYYDNVEDMYTAYYVYLNKDTINTGSNEVVDVSNNEVLKNLGIERIYFIDKDVFTNLYTKEVSNCENLDSLNCFDGSTIAYLKSIQNKANIDKCKEKKDCLTIVKINRKGHYYFAKYEAYNVKATAFNQSTTKPIAYSFANDSWTTIANNVRNGLGYKYNVGAEKEVSVGGTNYTVRVANNTTPSECSNEGFSQTACGFVVEFVDKVESRQMNSSRTNAGGWPATAMRTYANGDFLNKLPEELRKVIKSTKVVSGHGSSDKNKSRADGNWESEDKIYLFTRKEIHNVDDYDSTANNTRQLDYYNQIGVNRNTYSGAIKSGFIWWLRGAISNSNVNFQDVNGNGKWDRSYASDDIGFAPAFRIG